jgi:hypothetical protein
MFAVLWYWLTGNRVYFHQVGDPTRDTWWFRKLTASGKLLAITTVRPLYTCFSQARDLPFEIVDAVYEDHFKKSPLIQRLGRIYASESASFKPSGIWVITVKSAWNWEDKHSGRIGSVEWPCTYVVNDATGRVTQN